MRFSLFALVLAALVGPGQGSVAVQASAAPDVLAALLREVEDHTGGRLVFRRSDLPPGGYHDSMPELDRDGQLRAARIVLAEVRKLPAGYFKAIGLRAVGVFRSCASREGDGFRPYDKGLGGYRYYGIWNGSNAAACAFYSEAQLPQTLHHEVFHHVDATLRGHTDVERIARDPDFTKIRAGEEVYRKLALSAADLAALRAQARGRVLESVVSTYARKDGGEDKAETARYLLTNLADALVQVATRPQLPGSQRLLHVLTRYAEADGSADVRWFVAVALGRHRK